MLQYSILWKLKIVIFLNSHQQSPLGRFVDSTAEQGPDYRQWKQSESIEIFFFVVAQPQKSVKNSIKNLFVQCLISFRGNCKE